MAVSIRDMWPVPDSALRPALALALAIEHAPKGVLMLRNDGSGSLDPVVAEGMTDEELLLFGSQQVGVGPVGQAYAEHRRVSIRDCTADGEAESALRRVALGIGFRGIDVVPLALADGSVIGAVAALFPGARCPSARAGALAENCARLMALALDNARLRADADRRRGIVEALSRARMQFVARMSHELRTPLQSITGYIDLLALGKPDPLTPRQQRMMENVQVSERVLLQVMDDLTAMARLEEGRLDYAISDVSTRSAIDAAAVVIRPMADEKRVRLETPADGADFVARADDAKLRQVLINLMANAVKFTPSGGTVRVNCFAEDSAVILEVADTGQGIPAGKLEDAFEPYVQLGDAKSRIAGSGLGLAISREFVHRMGGSLSAISDEGLGSVFTVRLPRALSGSAPA
jgi:signal transduction histidine kinase